MKTFLIVLLVLAILVVAMVITVKIFMKVPAKVYECAEEVLQAKEGTARKALIVYQPSLSKASDEVARAIARGLNDSGFEVVLQCPGPEQSPDLAGYSIVVFGSPIYGGQPATTLTDYMQRIEDLSHIKVILFATAGGIAPGTEFDRMKEILGDIVPFASRKFLASQTAANQTEAYQMGVDAAREP